MELLLGKMLGCLLDLIDYICKLKLCHTNMDTKQTYGYFDFIQFMNSELL
jgi:hypothetical protein